jgi:hypothetical protein
MRDKPDEKLKEAMGKVRAILKEYDICGSVILSSPDAMEHLFEIEASWSCARVEYEDDDQVAIRIRTTDLPPERKKQVLEWTVGNFIGLSDVLRQHQKNCEVVMGVIADDVGPIEHRTERLE